METSSAVWLLSSIAIGGVYTAFLNRPESVLRTVFKALPVTLLAGFAWSVDAPALLLAALLLSVAGDAFLAYDGEGAFRNGLVSFLAAHLAYGVLFVSMAAPSVLSTEAWRLAAGAASVAAIAIVLPLLRRHAGQHRIAVSVYACVILGMALLALFVRAPAVFLGAAIFMSSDAVLALRRFVFRPDHVLSRIASYYVWISYFSAQCILAWALTRSPASL